MKRLENNIKVDDVAGPHALISNGWPVSYSCRWNKIGTQESEPRKGREQLIYECCAMLLLICSTRFHFQTHVIIKLLIYCRYRTVIALHIARFHIPCSLLS